MLWPACGLVGSFTTSFPQKRPMKVWSGVVSNHFPSRSLNPSLRCAGEMDPGGILAAHFSSVCSDFHWMSCCFMLTLLICDTLTWTSLPNCWSHGLQDFKGFVFLQESLKSITSMPWMAEWCGLSTNQSFKYVLQLVSFLWGRIYFR